MEHHKFGVRLFTLCGIAAVSLVIFGVASAQAAEFKILGSGALAPKETLSGTQVGASKILVPGRSLTLECQEGETAEGTFKSSIEILILILLKLCKALNFKKETEELSCVIPAKMIHLEFIVLASIIPPRLKIDPDEPETFGTVEFEKETGCALPLKNAIKGSIVTEPSAAEEVEPIWKFSEAIQKAGGAKMLFGTFESFIDGSFKLALTGAHKGCKWGVA